MRVLVATDDIEVLAAALGQHSADNDVVISCDT